MVTVEGTVFGSPQAVYQVFLDSAAYDARQALEEQKQAALTEGFSYVKPVLGNFGWQRGETRVTICALNPGRLYEAVFSNSQGETRIAYRLEEAGPGQTRVTYEEQTDSAGALQRLNRRLLAKWLEKKTQKRIRLLLAQIDRYLRQQAAAPAAE